MPPPETFSIVRAIKHYHPEFEPPETAPGWIKVQCPFHDDNRASAGINYEMDAFSCLGCGVSGNYYTLIAGQEASYAETKRVTEGVAAVGDRPIPPVPTEQSGRRVFGDPRRARGERPRTDGPVPSGIRGRTTPWT